MTITVERAALAGLWSVAGIGEVRIRKLRLQFDLLQIASLDPAEWLGQFELPPDPKAALLGMTLVERGHELLRKARLCQMKVAFLGDPAYPKLLASVERQPPLLFYKGRGEVPNRRRVAMVGTRKPENDILPFAWELARDTALQGVGVVSGCADGIDQICHQGALDGNGETWAVLGTGLDQIDRAQQGPCENILAKNGTVWSEYPPGVRSDQTKFPRRNRLIAWTSDVTVVIRGNDESGAWYTFDYAVDEQRPVMAVPSSPGVEHGGKPNRLIRSGKALWCLGVVDVLNALGFEGEVIVQKALPFDDSPLSERAQKALDALQTDKVDFDEWLYRVRATMTSSTLRSVLVELEMAGRVVECPGMLFQARG